MADIKSYKPGTFCWAELVASDSGKAKEFYGKLLGWEFTDVPLGNDMFYSMAYLNGKGAGALYQMWPEQREIGVHTNWGGYVSVADVEESAKKVESLGGRVIVGPMDVFDAGKMAGIVDPVGAVFYIWQPLNHIGAAVFGETGAVCWYELMTRDDDASAAFYNGLFGWNAQKQDFSGIQYTILMNGNSAVGGMLKTEEGMPSGWFVYFAVGDCDKSVEDAVSLGGRVLNPPMNVEGAGRMAFLMDSQGAMFSVIKPDPM